MLSRPVGLSDAEVVEGVRRGWGLRLARVEWAPLGFGSHHWRGWDVDGEAWFVTVDDLDHSVCDASRGREDTFERLLAALGVAMRARAAGLEFVLAPTRSAHGHVALRLGDRFTLAVYPLVDGATGAFGAYESRRDALDLLALLVRLHALTSTLRVEAPIDRGAVSRLDVLLAMADPSSPRSTRGPYGEAARRAIQARQSVLTRQSGRHVALWQRVSSPERLVITHGEPHPGNAMRTPDGWMLLDWDTTRLAPPERDLWMLAASVPDCVNVYAEQTGRAVLAEGIECYRLAWRLADAAAAAAFLRGPHDDTEDARTEWAILQQALEELGGR